MGNKIHPAASSTTNFLDRDSDAKPQSNTSLAAIQVLRPLRSTRHESSHNMTTSSTAPAGDLTTQVLHALSTQDTILSSETFPNVVAQDVKAALDRLASRSMITYETIEKEELALEAEGEQFVAKGSHEARVFEALSKAVDGLTIQELEKAIGDKNVTKVGQGQAFKEKWISKGSDGKLVASVSNPIVWRLGNWVIGQTRSLT